MYKEALREPVPEGLGSPGPSLPPEAQLEPRESLWEGPPTPATQSFLTPSHDSSGRAQTLPLLCLRPPAGSLLTHGMFTVYPGLVPSFL